MRTKLGMTNKLGTTVREPNKPITLDNGVRFIFSNNKHVDGFEMNAIYPSGKIQNFGGGIEMYAKGNSMYNMTETGRYYKADFNIAGRDKVEIISQSVYELNKPMLSKSSFLENPLFLFGGLIAGGLVIKKLFFDKKSKK